MRVLKIMLPVFALVMLLSSCGNICIRCENGITAETETKCFTNKKERQEYVNTREAFGFTCNEQ